MPKPNLQLDRAFARFKATNIPVGVGVWLVPGAMSTLPAGLPAIYLPYPAQKIQR